MPIKRKDRPRYPVNWKAISFRIRFERAAGRCECTGECGSNHGSEEVGDEAYWGEDRCGAVHGQPHPVNRSKVVLTVAHLDHTPERCSDDNLRAMCQACHLRYDAEHHAATAAQTRRARDGRE